jgi:hypothetical protein
MELIETLRNISVQEAFAKGRSVQTGLSVREGQHPRLKTDREPIRYI